MSRGRHHREDPIPADEQGEDADFLDMTDINPVMNSFRYLVMRVTRLVLTTVCEVILLASTVAFAFSIFVSFLWLISREYSAANWAVFVAQEFRNPTGFRAFALLHPFILGIVSFKSCVFFYGLSMTFGMPYKWKWRMPGSGSVICDTCHKKSADAWSCTSCRAPRTAARAGTWLIEKANVCVYWLWILHDITIGLVAFSL